jgi:plasmid stability protein
MATLTVRNVPDDLVARLKERARRHRRSLNSETIAALELVDAAEMGEAFLPEPLPFDREAAMAQIRAIQARFPGSPNATQDSRNREELQAQLDLFARLRSRFKGPPIPTQELMAAIERDSHPTEGEPFEAAQPTRP